MRSPPPNAPVLTPEKAEDQLLGRALKALREASDPRITQSDAAAAADVTLQAWQNYEAGKRRFSEALIGKVTRALGLARDDLLAERDRVLDEPPGEPRQRLERSRAPARFEIPVNGRGRAGAMGLHVYDTGQSEGVVDLAQLLGSDAKATRAAGESMIPYVEPGAFVVYHTSRWPRRGRGCVIETKSGELYIKRYEKTDGTTLFVSELFPVERELKFSLSDVAGVYAIGLRED